MYDVFRAGVEPGGLTMDYEIKILICYILRSLGHPMPISALIEVFVSEGSATILRLQVQLQDWLRVDT